MSEITIWKANFADIMFVRTPPMYLGPRQVSIIAAALNHPEGLTQKKIGDLTGIDPSSVSTIKTDLKRLGWITETNLGLCKEIRIKPSINLHFKQHLEQWLLLRNTVLVRPHKLELRGCFVGKITWEEKQRLLLELCKRPSSTWLKCGLMNNCEYRVTTDSYVVRFWKESTSLRLIVPGFVLPIHRDYLPFFKTLLIETMQEQLDLILRDFSTICSSLRIKVHQGWFLPEIDLGVLVKEDVYSVLNLQEVVRKHDIFADKSVGGCKELEIRAVLEEATNVIARVLEDVFACMDD